MLCTMEKVVDEIHICTKDDIEDAGFAEKTHEFEIADISIENEEFAEESIELIRPLSQGEYFALFVEERAVRLRWI